MDLLNFQAVAPGDPNPDCPAEPNIPWMLILGGTGIGLLLLLRIAIVKCLRCIKNNQVGNIWYEIGVTIHNHLSDLLRWRGWLFLRVWLQRDVRHHAHGRHRYVDGACHLVGLQVRLSFQSIDFNWKYPRVSGIGLAPTPCTRWLARSNLTTSEQVSATRTKSTWSSSPILTVKTTAIAPSTWSPLWYSLLDG